MLEPVSTPPDASMTDARADSSDGSRTRYSDARTLCWTECRTDPERARALAHSACEAALAIGDRRGAAAARLTLARCELDAADAAHLGEVQAILDLEDAERGAEYGVEETGMVLVQALIFCRRGDYDGALTYALAGLKGARKLGAALDSPNAKAGTELESRNLEVQRIQAQALRVAGEVYGYCNLEKSCDLLREALGAAQTLGDSFEVSETLLLLGRSYRLSGDYRETLRYGLEALGHKRAAGDRIGEAFALNALGLVYHDPGDNAQALTYYLEGLALSETLGDRRSMMALLGNLSEVYSGEAGLGAGPDSGTDPTTDLDSADVEHLERALEYTHRSLELSEEIGSLGTAGISLRSLGTLYTRKGDPDKALAFFGRALELQRNLGDEHGQALTLCELTEACAAAGKPEAAEHYRESLALARGDHARPYILAQVLASFGAHTQ